MFCIHCWGLDEFAEIDFAAPWTSVSGVAWPSYRWGPCSVPRRIFARRMGHMAGHFVDRTQLSDPVPLTYVGLTGIGKDAAFLPRGDPLPGVFGFGRVTRPQDISDGASTTLMVIESSDLRGVWVAGGEATVRGVDPAKRPYLGPGRAVRRQSSARPWPSSRTARSVTSETRSRRDVRGPLDRRGGRDDRLQGGTEQFRSSVG